MRDVCIMNDFACLGRCPQSTKRNELSTTGKKALKKAITEEEQELRKWGHLYELGYRINQS